MNLYSYNSLNAKQHASFFKFLESTQDYPDLAKSNMYDVDWNNKPNTLPYILTYTDRFKDNSGELNILFDNDDVVAVSGVYMSNFSEYISIAGVRTFIDSKHRHNTRSIIRQLLHRHKDWSIEHNCKIVIVTFNEYNKNLINLFKRCGVSDSLLDIPRSDNHMFNKEIHEVEFPCNIQHTKQYVFYEKLDESFSFDWSELKY
jgi:hypothetical protein